MDSTESTSVPSQPAPNPNNRTVMGILSYIGPLVIVSYLVAKDDPFVKFHVRQGIVLFAIEVVIWLLGSSFWLFGPIAMVAYLINLGTFVLSIVGIVNVVQGKEQPLPLIGGWGARIPL